MAYDKMGRWVPDQPATGQMYGHSAQIPVSQDWTFGGGNKYRPGVDPARDQRLWSGGQQFSGPDMRRIRANQAQMAPQMPQQMPQTPATQANPNSYLMQLLAQLSQQQQPGGPAPTSFSNMLAAPSQQTAVPYEKRMAAQMPATPTMPAPRPLYGFGANMRNYMQNKTGS